MRVNEYQYRTIDGLVISSTRDKKKYDDDNAQWMETSTAPLELNPKDALLLRNTLDRGSGIFKNILKTWGGAEPPPQHHLATLEQSLCNNKRSRILHR